MRFRGTGIERLIVVATAVVLVTVLVPVLITAVWSARQDAAAELARHGNTVAERLAASAAESVLATQRIALSVLVREFTRMEAVATAAVYSADHRLLAAADDSAISPAELDARQTSSVFIVPIPMQDSIAGYARIGIDRDAFAPRHQPLLLGIAASTTTLVLLLAAVLGARLQRRLQRMRELLESELDQQAHARDPFDALTELLDPPATADSAVDPLADIDRASTDQHRPLYLVVVNLFNQISLSHDERSAVLERCEALLDRVCRLYGGRHERLPGTGLVIVLDALSESGDHAFQAICAALLATRVFEELNLERRHDGAVRLALRVGVERIVDAGDDPDADARGDADMHADPESARPHDRTLIGNFPETVSRAVTLSALARERTIAIGDAVHAACSEPARLVARPLQSPVLRATGSDDAWLVEDLAERYRDLLDRQAQLLLGA